MANDFFEIGTPKSVQSQNQINFSTDEGMQQIDNILSSLEDHLAQQLRNHKLFLDDIQSIEEERNFYYRKLRLVEDQCNRFPNCASQKEVMAIISDVPEDFIRGESYNNV